MQRRDEDNNEIEVIKKYQRRKARLTPHSGYDENNQYLYRILSRSTRACFVVRFSFNININWILYTNNFISKNIDLHFYSFFEQNEYKCNILFCYFGRLIIIHFTFYRISNIFFNLRNPLLYNVFVRTILIFLWHESVFQLLVINRTFIAKRINIMVFLIMQKLPVFYLIKNL